MFFFESKVKRLDDDGEFASLLSKPQTWRREKDWKDVKGTCSDGLSSWIVEIQNVESWIVDLKDICVYIYTYLFGICMIMYVYTCI